jgi:hypothetical protein
MLFLILNLVVQFKLDPDLNPEPEPDSEPEYITIPVSVPQKQKVAVPAVLVPHLLHTGTSKTLPTL